jgi:hypothetical protein
MLQPPRPPPPPPLADRTSWSNSNDGWRVAKGETAEEPCKTTEQRVFFATLGVVCTESRHHPDSLNRRAD